MNIQSAVIDKQQQFTCCRSREKGTAKAIAVVRLSLSSDRCRRASAKRLDERLT